MFHDTAAVGRFIWSDVIEAFRTSSITFHHIMPHQQKVRPAGDIWQQHPQMRRYASGRWVGKLYWKVPILWWCRETLYKSYWCSAGIIKMTTCGVITMWFIFHWMIRVHYVWIYLTQVWQVATGRPIRSIKFSCLAAEGLPGHNSIRPPLNVLKPC